jgi:hypothetical protein
MMSNEAVSRHLGHLSTSLDLARITTLSSLSDIDTGGSTIDLLRCTVSVLPMNLKYQSLTWEVLKYQSLLSSCVCFVTST